jgi:hypothetical protein
MPNLFRPDHRFEIFPPGTWEETSDEMEELWLNQGLPASWVERREALRRGL